MIRAWPTLRVGVDVFTKRFALLMGASLVVSAAQQGIALGRLLPENVLSGYAQLPLQACLSLRCSLGSTSSH